MQVHATEIDPSFNSKTWEERWKGPDRGLIAAWVRGRAKASEDKELAAAASRGELIVLPWKGGVAQASKVDRKYGPYLYLAMWQGLRCDPLDIDTECEITLTCSKTGMTVTYTSDASKFSQQS